MKEVDRLDEALAEHYRTGDYVPLGMATQDNWPTVRSELERLREERDAGLRLTLTRIGHAPWCKCDICAPTRELLGGRP